MGNDISGSKAPQHAKIGAYRIVKPLGQGGFGEVFLARSSSDTRHRMVALKKLPMHLDFTAAEIESLGRLPRHENIAQLLEVVTQAPLVWVALEYCDLGSLAQLLEKRGRLHAPLVQRLARHLSAALAACHSAGVVHADIKPENVMLSSSHDGPVAKLIDFSVAKIKEPYYQESTNTNLLWELKPMPYYAAPESFERAQITEKSDMFSFGLLVYTMLSGSVAPEGCHGACVTDGAWAGRPFCQLPQCEIDRCVQGVSCGEELRAVLLDMLRLSAERRSSARVVCKQLGSAAALLKDCKQLDAAVLALRGGKQFNSPLHKRRRTHTERSL